MGIQEHTPCAPRSSPVAASRRPCALARCPALCPPGGPSAVRSPVELGEGVAPAARSRSTTPGQAGPGPERRAPPLTCVPARGPKDCAVLSSCPGMERFQGPRGNKCYLAWRGKGKGGAGDPRSSTSSRALSIAKGPPRNLGNSKANQWYSLIAMLGTTLGGTTPGLPYVLRRLEGGGL